jgi:hypothetical protein
LFVYLLLLQLGALSHMVGNSLSLLPYNSTTKKIERILQWNTWEMRWWMHACNHSFWRENKIDMHLCCCKETKFQNRLL